MRRAVIDIGSNTINLVIGEFTSTGTLTILHEEKNHAKLAKGGLINGYITSEALSRGYEAVSKYYERCTEFSLEKKHIKAYATATIRNTKNGVEFTQSILSKYGIETSIIDGETEAELIFEGIRNGFPMNNTPVLAIDIGGGSVEFIIGNIASLHYKQSFPIGVSKTLDMLKPSDPFSKEDFLKLDIYFQEQLATLFESIAQYKPQIIVGSSGSFDTLRNMILSSHPELKNFKTHMQLPLHLLDGLFKKIENSSIAERKLMDGMDPMRVDYMPIAATLLRRVLKESKIEEIHQCSYALKEGALFKV